jgi:hypothetical protein
MKPKDMNDKQRFQLINGTFTPSEAAQVLLSLVKSKIDYHSLEKLSNEERFGRDLSHSETRLQRLRTLKTELEELFDSAAQAKQNLKIDGWIEIKSV